MNASDKYLIFKNVPIVVSRKRKSVTKYFKKQLENQKSLLYTN